jgi:hypothetical protein
MFCLKKLRFNRTLIQQKNIFMKTFLITIVTLFSVSVFAQNNLESDLHQTLIEWNKGNHSSEANFKQLVKQYPYEWLPKYYLAFSETLSVLQSNDKDYNQAKLTDINVLVDDLVRNNPKNAEVFNLKALYLTAEIIQNPMQNGAIFYSEVLDTYQNALSINTNNPRSVLGLAEFNINAAKYNRKDITQDCESVKKSLALFDAEKKSTTEPRWGKDRAEALLNNQCKK